MLRKRIYNRFSSRPTIDSPEWLTQNLDRGEIGLSASL